MVEDSQFGEKGVDGEGEGSLESEVVGVEALWQVLEACEVCGGKGVGVVIEEIVRGHREGSVVVGLYFGGVFDSEDAEDAVGGRETPTAAVLDEGERVVVCNGEVGDGVGVLLGRPENGDPVLTCLPLVQEQSADANDSHFVHSHHHLVEPHRQLTVLECQNRLVVVRHQGVPDDRQGSA